METASDKKRFPLVNRNVVILYPDDARPHTLIDRLDIFDWENCFILHILLTLFLQIITLSRGLLEHLYGHRLT